MVKRIIFIAIIVFCLIIINNLAHSIYDLWTKQSLITQTQQELDKKQAENKRLKQELAEAQSSTYVEQQARDKLFLVKPGEEHVIIPTDLSKKIVVTPAQTPHWQEWLNLFTN